MTAIQEFMSFLEYENKIDSVTMSVIRKYLPQFIEQERQQVVGAWEQGFNDCRNGNIISAKDYYNQTYQQNSKPS
jgi:hypothetical protein